MSGRLRRDLGDMLGQYLSTRVACVGFIIYGSGYLDTLIYTENSCVLLDIGAKVHDLVKLLKYTE